MDTLTGLYLLLQLDSIKSFLSSTLAFMGTVSSISMLAWLAWTIIATIEKSSNKPPRKLFVVSFITGIFSILLGITNALLPTTERAAMMVVGAKIIDSNTTSILSNIPEKYAKILEQKADAYMKEMEKQK